MPPWELAEGDSPKMWGNGSEISWNAATYQLLGDPACVELMHDAEQGRLGFRGVYYRGAIRVKETEDFRFTIDVDEYLDNLDLSLPAEWEATPALETDETAPGVAHQDRIVWITIPE